MIMDSNEDGMKGYNDLGTLLVLFYEGLFVAFLLACLGKDKICQISVKFLCLLLSEIISFAVDSNPLLSKAQVTKQVR